MQTEERVQVAIENWAPRFIANGVDPNDFQRISKRVERWEDWSQAWSEVAAMHEQMGEEAEAQECYESAAYHYFHAAITYHFGKFLFVQRPAELRAAHEKVVQTYQRALPYFDVPGERVAIPYEGGAAIPGILRKPWHIPRPPVVVLMPGLDSVKEELHSYGDDFLRRGLAVLAIDGPGQGEMEFDYPIRYDYEVPIHHVIDYLANRPDVNAARVGLMGVSLGGYYAVRAAAFEPRVKASICLAGAANLAEHWERYPVLTKEAFIYRSKSADEAEARAFLQSFNLHGVAEQLTPPLLVVMGRKDRLFPAGDAEYLASAAARGELLMLEDGNHVCNNVPYKYRPQQADWMRKQLCK
jgi:dienelactone hydrolase